MTSDKLAIITDTHLEARNGSATFRQLFREYYRDVFFPYIKQNNIKTILHGGDFFDNRNHVTIAGINYIIHEFLPLLEDSGATMYVIAGNHDTMYRNTNDLNSLAILSTSPNVNVVYDKLEIIETGGSKKIVLCPWLNASTEDLLPELQGLATDDYILLGHFEIEGAKMYKNSKVCEHGTDAATFKGFNQVWSGHFHHKSRYGSNIQYLGALFHYTWQDYDDWRGFHLYDPHTNELEPIENEYCLFSAVDYETALELDDSDLKDVVEGQFVRVYIEDEHDKVERKELISRIEKHKPVSVDVIDNTILDQVSTDDENAKQSNPENRTIDEYADTYIKGSRHPERAQVVFNQILEAARSRRVEVE